MNTATRNTYLAACRALRAAAKFPDEGEYANGPTLRQQIGAEIYTAAHRSVFCTYSTQPRILHLRTLLATARRNHWTPELLRADVRTDALIHYFIPLP